MALNVLFYVWLSILRRQHSTLMKRMYLSGSRTQGWICRCFILCVYFAVAASHASDLDTIGVTLLRKVTTNLDGSGVRVVHAEARVGSAFEVNPGTVGSP